ncbi:citrate lyase holo-[acyl-carrier protein] synthase [Tindallia californiensis]|uniref:citrate lyase holo-[acyl-carrier protein] synthase n=1 Tax=Tindallia californiensis TaxID=159292 RepID=UPI001A9A5525|nr:citrate lyase holo-[acyl-carrier protein] synthase [Tindallia californiensis]
MDKRMRRVLEAKEERSAFQKEWIARYQLPMISLTLNLPGGFEAYKEWETIFHIALKTIDRAYDGNIVDKHSRLGKWGPEGFWVIDLPAVQIKEKAIDLENSHRGGRIFDIDVLDEKGSMLSRRDLLMEGRVCLVCDEKALLCYREKKHDFEEVKASAQKIIFKGLVTDE